MDKLSLGDNKAGVHATTDCDSTSQMVGHGKKNAWKVFQTDHYILEQLGNVALTDETSSAA